MRYFVRIEATPDGDGDDAVIQRIATDHGDVGVIVYDVLGNLDSEGWELDVHIEPLSER